MLQRQAPEVDFSQSILTWFVFLVSAMTTTGRSAGTTNCCLSFALLTAAASCACAVACIWADGGRILNPITTTHTLPTRPIRCRNQSHLDQSPRSCSRTGRATTPWRTSIQHPTKQQSLRVRVMSSSRSLHAALLLALFVALASMAATVHSFVAPAARLSSAVRRWTYRLIDSSLF